MPQAEHRTFASPDEVRTFERGRMELVEIGGGHVGRLVLEPGWRWSEHVRPIAGTDWCEAPHFQYHASGTIRIQMADGTEFRRRPRRAQRPPGRPRRLGARRRGRRADRLARRPALRRGVTRG